MNHSTVLLEDVQIAALRGQHKTFQQATMDFCDLQRIDYKQAFHCSHGMKHCSVDGIVISCHVRDTHMVRPWAADPESEIVWGSTHAARTALPTRARRAELMKLVKDGLPGHELDTLVGALSTSASPLEAEFADLLRVCTKEVTDGKGSDVYVAQKHAAFFFKNIAADSPATALLRPWAEAVVDRWLGGEPLTSADRAELPTACPALCELITWADNQRRAPTGAGAAAAVVKVLSEFLKV